MENKELINKKTKKNGKFYKIWNYFNLYEKLWLLSLTAVAVSLAFIFPDEETSVSIILTIFSVIAVVSGILCELLISKQSKWNFVISFTLVEISEIIICLILHYYASAIVTLVFWIPVDIISFINWNKHKDKQDEKVTEVKKLSWKMDVLVILAICAFSALVGWLLNFIGGEDTYIDALVAGLGMANGIFILLRFREQWIAWLLYTIFEAVLWILSGNYIMLVLTAGYLSNTIYGYIKWTIYCKKHNSSAVEKIE